MEEKKLSLVDMLQGADKKNLVLYSPMFGDVVVTSVDRTFIKCIRLKDEKKKAIVFNPEGRIVHVYFGHGNSDVSDEIMLFPSRTERDWNNFSFNVYPGLPASWDEYWTNELKAVVSKDKEFPYADKVKTFQMLLILRDRYNRESHDKQMNFEISSNKNGVLRVQRLFETNRVMHFSNQVLAEKFLENFRDMLEQVKDML